MKKSQDPPPTSDNTPAERSFSIKLPALLARSECQKILERIATAFSFFPDSRKPSSNRKYSVQDAFLSAFSVFFTLCPSFLAYQKQMLSLSGRSNLFSLFGAHNIPSDNQIRSIIDPVPPHHVGALISEMGEIAFEQNVLKPSPVLGTHLTFLDGTDSFSSHKLGCPSCSTAKSKDQTLNRHIVVTPVIVAPDESRVLPLPPIFVTSKPDQSKQDCELGASSDWLDSWGAHYAPRGITLLGDDLYCHHPFCQKVLEKKMHFIFTCKPSSHTTLYEWLDDFTRMGSVETVVVKNPRGKQGQKTYGVTNTYRFAKQLPLRNSDDALLVNWCELISTDQTGKVLFHNTWATSHDVTKETVVAIAQAGRSRWKGENENYNVLKNGGYNFQHNFGHGKQHLSNTLTALNLLAFLLHNLFDWIDPRYRALRFRLGSRSNFFNLFTMLLNFFPFEQWDDLIAVMFSKLRPLDSG